MIITLINLKTIMFSCFTFAYEEENDIILINDLIDLTLSFLYECPKCKSCTVDEDCQEVYELEYTTDISRRNQRNLEKCCANCYREWRMIYNGMRYRERKAKLLSDIINWRTTFRRCVRRLMRRRILIHHHAFV